MREEVDRLKGKLEEVRKEVRVTPKNKAEGDRSENGTGQVRLNNTIAGSE